MLEKGLKIFKEKGEKAVYKEMKQFNNRIYHLPLCVDNITIQDKMKVQDTIVLLTEKRDRMIKAQSVYNRKDT